MTGVVVVGGGVAGLVAARRLARGGAKVTLLEASDHLGGTVTGHLVGGLLLDAGAESFAVRGGTVAALAAELGLGDEIVTPSGDGAWLQRASGDAVPLPATSILGIPGVPLARDVIAVVGWRTALRAYAEVFLPSAYGAKAATLGELVRTRMGRGMLDGLVTPVAGGVHSKHPDDLLLDRVSPGLRRELRRYGSLARAVREMRASAPAGAAVEGVVGGIHRLVDELVVDLGAFGVEVRLGTRVTRVEPGAAWVAAAEGEERLEGDIVVAAPHIPGATREPVTAPDTAVTLATLVVRTAALDAAPRGSGLLVAPGTTVAVAKALTHATAKWSWLAERAGALHVIRLSYDPARIETLGVAELRELARRDASALLGVEIPSVDIEDFARVDWNRPAPQGAAAPGITLVGEATSGTGLASVVAQATRVAEEMLAVPDPASTGDAPEA